MLNVIREMASPGSSNRMLPVYRATMKRTSGRMGAKLTRQTISEVMPAFCLSVAVAHKRRSSVDARSRAGLGDQAGLQPNGTMIRWTTPLHRRWNCPVRDGVFLVLVVEDAPSRTFEIFILVGPDTPDECDNAQPTQDQGDRDEKPDYAHRRRPARRSALLTTSNDELDMVIAAISGVTMPSMAKGTARML